MNKDEKKSSNIEKLWKLKEFIYKINWIKNRQSKVFGLFGQLLKLKSHLRNLRVSDSTNFSQKFPTFLLKNSWFLQKLLKFLQIDQKLYFSKK